MDWFEFWSADEFDPIEIDYSIRFLIRSEVYYDVDVLVRDNDDFDVASSSNWDMHVYFRKAVFDENLLYLNFLFERLYLLIEHVEPKELQFDCNVRLCLSTRNLLMYKHHIYLVPLDLTDDEFSLD